MNSRLLLISMRFIVQKFSKTSFHRMVTLFFLGTCISGLFMIACGRSSEDPSLMSGTLSVIQFEGAFHADEMHKHDHADEKAFFLQTNLRKKPYQLKIPHQLQGGKKLFSGLHVKVKIADFEQSLLEKEVLSIEDIVVETPTVSKRSNYLALTKTSHRKILVVLTHLIDEKVAGPITDKNYISETISELNKLYDESTHGMIRFDFDPEKDLIDINLGLTREECLSQDIIQIAQEKIGKTDHQHVLLLPPSGACARYSGYASMGSPNTSHRLGLMVKTKGEGTIGLGILAHELGHNLGLGHSGRDHNDDGHFGSPGWENVSEFRYGDFSSFMAAVNGSSLNAVQMFLLGVFHRFPGSVVEAHNQKEYTISALHLDPKKTKDPQVVVFRKPESDQIYILSYKPKDRPSSHHPIESAKTGVSIHTTKMDFRSESMLIRTLRQENEEEKKEGKRFSFYANTKLSLKVEQISVKEDGSSVKVRIFFKEPSSSPGCEMKPLKFELLDDESNKKTENHSILVEKEKQKSIRFRVTNYNDLSCRPAYIQTLSFVDGQYDAIGASGIVNLEPQTDKIINIGIKNDAISRYVKFSFVNPYTSTLYETNIDTCVSFIVDGSPQSTDRSICNRSLEDIASRQDTKEESDKEESDKEESDKEESDKEESDKEESDKEESDKEESDKEESEDERPEDPRGKNWDWLLKILENLAKNK